MNHGGMDHGDMDHGGGGGMHDMCNMNVRLLTPISVFFIYLLTFLLVVDALHMGYNQSLHRLSPMAHPIHHIPHLLPPRRNPPRCRIRSPTIPLPTL